MSVKPEILKNDTENKIISGRLYFDGNLAYVPKNIVENNSSPNKIKYTYDIKYVNGNTQWDGLNLFNPLILVGFEMGEESVIVNAKLEINSDIYGNYAIASSCIANKSRNLYQNGGSSEPRKMCLLAVKENLEMQIYQLNLGVKNEK